MNKQFLTLFISALLSVPSVFAVNEGSSDLSVQQMRAECEKQVRSTYNRYLPTLMLHCCRQLTNEFAYEATMSLMGGRKKGRYLLYLHPYPFCSTTLIQDEKQRDCVFSVVDRYNWFTGPFLEQSCNLELYGEY
jgi:hypothetical protein